MDNETDHSRSIPHDVTIDILARLPVKSLCRFRCVSALWNSTISDPSFTRLWYNHSSSRPDGTSLLLIIPNRKGFARTFYSVDYREGDDNLVAVKILTVPGYVDQYVSESLNGLMCLKLDFSYKICNPSTREVITLPKREVDTVPPLSYRSHTVKYFFGYDPISNEHKVLSLSVMRECDDIGNGIIMENKVFVVGDFTWKRIPDGPPHVPQSYPRSDGVCVKGILYYSAWTKMGDSRVAFVMAFDVALETFRRIEMPGGELHLYEDSGLMKYDDRIAIIDYQFLKIHNRIEIWVLEDDSLESNWIHRNIVFSYIGTDIPDYTDFYLAGTFLNGEVLMITRKLNKPFYMFYLNLKTASVRRAEVHCLPEYETETQWSGTFRFINATDHVESIVPLCSLVGY